MNKEGEGGIIKKLKNEIDFQGKANSLSVMITKLQEQLYKILFLWRPQQIKEVKV